MEDGIVMNSDNGADRASTPLINDAVPTSTPLINDAVPASTPRDEEAFKERREKLQHLQKQAFQLANYYFVFQGVIFTSFYSGPHTKDDVRCKYRWVPITLSSLAAAINLCALAGIINSYKSMLDDIDRSAVGNTGGSLPFSMRLEKMSRIIWFVVCMLLFLGFFGVTIAGCVLITCYHT